MGRESYQKKLLDRIRTVQGPTTMLIVPAVFLPLCGDLQTAVVLAVLVYWCDKGIRKDGYIWKSASQWFDETRLPKYQIRKSTKRLVEMGLITTKIMLANGSQTVHYHLNKRELDTAIDKMQSVHRFSSTDASFQMERSITEITHQLPETTNNGSSRPESRRPRAVSFNGYIKENGEENNGSGNVIDPDVVRGVKFYLRRYRSAFGRSHPRLTFDQWSDVCSRLFEFEGGYDRTFDVDLGEFRSAVDAHFRKDYDGGTDYNILHFVTGMIRTFRLSEANNY